MSDLRTNVPSESVEQAPKKVVTGAHLPWWRAMFHPFKSGEIDFYPRLGNPSASIKTSSMIAEMMRVTEQWSGVGDSDDLDDALDLAKASLSEAKAQTEYQDQKATRLLTVTTFLTALAGAFFGSFSAEYPLRTLRFDGPGTSWLIIATYVFFLLFLISAILGALISFHATRTRFKYPPEATVASQDGPTRSFLFFREMIGVTPAGWANSFVEGQGKDAKIKADLNWPISKITSAKPISSRRRPRTNSAILNLRKCFSAGPCASSSSMCFCSLSSPPCCHPQSARRSR